MQFKKNIEGHYNIRPLTLRDESLLESLCKRCSDYYVITEGHKPNANNVSKIIEEIPPGKKYKDKYVIGIFDSSDKLIGVLDMIKDYPMKQDWVLSLLMIDPAKRHMGIGKSVHKYITNQLFKTGAAQLKICVTENNKSAYEFWRSLGYIENYRKQYVLGSKQSVFIIMTLSLINKKHLI